MALQNLRSLKGGSTLNPEPSRWARLFDRSQQVCQVSKEVRSPRRASMCFHLSPRVDFLRLEAEEPTNLAAYSLALTTELTVISAPAGLWTFASFSPFSTPLLVVSIFCLPPIQKAALCFIMIATRLILSLSLSAIGAAAQALESPDFNVTQQLLDLGVNVGDLPELSNFVERRSANLPCAAACLSLSVTFGRDSVLFRGEAPYESFTGAYWSENQGEVNPYCIFKPANPSAVSVLVLLSRLTQCPFAVKSGGHAAFAGASSIEGGITVSLEKINQVTLSSDKKTVLIGAGNQWSDVYRKLSKSDVAVTGGRVSSVGVGGLSLGGGISFFSNLHGWACDNVESYEVVTATGIILTASPKQNPNLYWALRGGGNNFGIVTNFTFRTIPLPGGQLWGGTKTFMEPALDAVVDAFAGMVTDSPQDPNAGLWASAAPNPVMIFQAITTGQMARMRANGGNPLGLDAADGPLYLIHVACLWQDAAGDAAIYAMISTVLARITAEAKALGLQNDYVYMNYASAFQDVIKGYGAANAARLKSIARTYDVTGVFQRLQPGHFKLNRAPVTGTGYFSGLDA
ncbi:FAD binding domain-containing protein [Verticillium alfalfae VaMs.102]|uniref:FAD binding domain-containing protein n=1 Tax=Verticillium alfalfae (strain VaMs.102 / ATCC MYA-4576 / FGSC 10136) TaxID=526221 RepID=C9SE66_VERA1|nr:FAD binding domain-containing protein [Verticillium alfalfae VaMs.102]EEY16475.1 FAD binding domain-containing protein [Verticillium alfalfae VaMs.102]